MLSTFKRIIWESQISSKIIKENIDIICSVKNSGYKALYRAWFLLLKTFFSLMFNVCILIVYHKYTHTRLKGNTPNVNSDDFWIIQWISITLNFLYFPILWNENQGRRSLLFKNSPMP